MRPHTTMRQHMGSGAAFVAWALVAVLGLLTIGAAFTPIPLLTAPVAALLTVALSISPRARASIFGLLSGLGAPFVVFALVDWNRAVQVCSSTAVGQSCRQQGNPPWPWLAVGLALIAAGLAAHVLRRRVAPKPTTPWPQQPYPTFAAQAPPTSR